MYLGANSKTVFVGIETLKFGVMDAVICFNDGYLHYFEAHWLSGSISRFHATGLEFKPRSGQGRLRLSSLQWADKGYQACLETKHWGFRIRLTTGLEHLLMHLNAQGHKK
ncbi:hypothetical protein TNCV_3778071 [Trichonephila clavipes]|nr:hypothetical protein TNCV_3778071 [Trichonephila clavipes]